MTNEEAQKTAAIIRSMEAKTIQALHDSTLDAIEAINEMNDEKD